MRKRMHEITVIGAVVVVAGSLASAQSMQRTYDVSHNFVFNPAGDVAEVVGYEFRHAWVRSSNPFGPGLLELEEHVPDVQDPGFDPWGWDFIPGGQSNAMNSGIGGHAVPVRYNMFNIPNTGTNPPGGGWPPAGCTFLELQPSFTRALACNVIEVLPWTNQAPLHIEGRIQSYGYAWSNVNSVTLSRAYAFSTSAVRVRGGYLLSNGSIQWIPGFLVDSVGAGASSTAVRLTDPIAMTAINTATGDTVEHVLLDIQVSFGGEGTAEWNGNAMTVDMPDFELRIDLPGAVVAPGQAGSMILRIESGVVVDSVGTGLFTGVAPPPGISVPLTIAMPDLRFDYDLGLDPNEPWDVETAFSGGGDGESELAGLGCPADIAEPFGVLDLNDVNAFIIGFLEQLPIADINGDGILDLQDVNMFIESFVSGCVSDSD